MKMFLSFIYRTLLVTLMVTGILFLAEKLPFYKDEENSVATNTSENEGITSMVNSPPATETHDTTITSSISIPTVTPEPIITPTVTPTNTPEPIVTPAPAEQTTLETITDSIPTTTTLTGRDALHKISSAVVTNSNGYYECFGNSDKSVFAESVANIFAFSTAVSYNLWSNNIQEVTLNASKLSKSGSVLSFKTGIASGGDGCATIQIFLDEDTEIPACEYTLDSKQPPVDIVLDLTEHTTLVIRVNNHASTANHIICYDLALEGGTEV